MPDPRILHVLDFASFACSENRASELLQLMERQNGKTHRPRAEKNHQLQRGEEGGGGEGERTHHAPLFQALTLFAEHPVQVGMRYGGGRRGGWIPVRGVRTRIDVCVQAGMQCVRDGPCGVVR